MSVITTHRHTLSDRLPLWGIVALAALLRLVYALTPRVVRWDEAGHLMVARNLTTGHGYSELAGTMDVHLPPVLPLVSAGLLKLGMSPPWATATIHIITGALLCLPIYALGQAIYGRRVGLIAATLVAVYPALAAWPYLWSTMTESPFLLCVFAGVWSVRQALHTRRTAWHAAIGLSFGLAYLTRPEGLTYFAVLGLFMVAWHLVHRTFWRAGAIARLTLAVVVCLATMSPYVLYLHHVTGRWTLSGKVGLILDIAPAYVAHDQAAHDLAVSRLDSKGTEIMWLSPDRFDRSLTGYVLANPARFFYQVRQNMAETWRALFHQDLFSPWVIALAALGAFATSWPRKRVADEGLLWATLLPLTSFWLFFVIDRFLVGALPIGLLWAAAGLDHLSGWTRGMLKAYRPLVSRTSRTLGRALPLGIILAFCLAVAPQVMAGGIHTMSWNHVQAGAWLRENTPPDERIMTRHTEIGIYADRPLVASPNATWEEVVAYGRARNAAYLVVDTWEIATLRPQLGILLEPDKIPPEVEHVRTFPGTNPVMIYRLVTNHE